MDTPIIKIDPANVSGGVLDKVVERLNRGGIIGYPTETVYGLGGNAEDPGVIERIYRLKERDSQRPFLMLIAGQESIHPFVTNISRAAEILMNRFWPGPLTLVFDASPLLPESLIGKKGKVAVRVSSDPVCRVLLEKYQKPIISTSANPSGMEPARSAADVLEFFKGKIDLILDGGMRLTGIPSTILDISGETPRFIRKGSIQKETIESVMGDLHDEETF